MEPQIEHADRGSVPSRPAVGFSRRKGKAHVLQRLVAGFTVILVLLGVDGFVGFWGAKSVRISLQSLIDQQMIADRLVEQLQDMEVSLRSIEYGLFSSGSKKSDTDLQAALARLQGSVATLFAEAASSEPNDPAWADLKTAVSNLTAQLERAISDRQHGISDEAVIRSAHEKLSFSSRNIIRVLHRGSAALRDRIDEATAKQTIEDRMILAACVLVASLFLLAGTRIYRRMTEQSEQLEIVSWQLLERQESLAQRLSRDLHDELGQSLTALKTNFSSHAKAGCADSKWMQDCTDLLKGSIRSAHEISQLLRPTLLDDFGLDCALAWLCEKFEERHRIKVKYTSDFRWRLDEQAETQVFRIAQEALTNVARHAEATSVSVSFSKQAGIVRLSISDDGKGLRPQRWRDNPPLGLTGMKARAHSLGGELTIASSPGHGVSIELVFRARTPA